MDRAKKLATMALRLRHAASANDWRHVAILDRELAALLPQLARATGWAAADAEAFEMLRNVHAEVHELCVREAKRAGTQLAEHRDRKGGWMAYAMSAPEVEPA